MAVSPLWRVVSRASGARSRPVDVVSYVVTGGHRSDIRMTLYPSITTSHSERRSARGTWRPGREPGAALALAENLRVLTELGLIEMRVDEAGQDRFGLTGLGGECESVIFQTYDEEEETA